MVLGALDPVRSNNSANRFAELEGRSAWVAATIIRGSDFQGLHYALLVVGDLHVKDPVRTMHFSTRHVLQSILNKPDRAL